MFRKIWKDPVWSKVIAVGVLALISLIASYFSGVWPFIYSTLSQAWYFLLASTSVSNWLLGIMIVPFFLLGYALLIAFKEWLFGIESELNFKDYTKDNFFGLLWVWRYSGNRIDNLHSLCPRCQYQILPKDSSSYAAVSRYEFICEDCGYSGGYFEGYPEELHQKVELKIQKALRTGEWVEKQNA
ncbi:hypothetical protein [Thiorhodococcus minor]|uniref:Uncharacterized protein n=1 Tax=Thiorhodococcus minor TaxID=57489 RepID=A0A6M0K696_9GAMM|nr:hypothetical protein [Thiorhodococcus minor]NEV65288.1 hypothetical protein [Thiorhodococcus minor]